MKLKIYQIDAFASKAFRGNPAAVIPLEKWLSDDTLQKIAEENNLSETAYFVKEGEKFHLRWFTPRQEVKLCGHATLASAYVIFNHLDYKTKSVVFSTLSGDLKVKKEKDYLIMDFPESKFKIAKLPDGMFEGLGALPQELFRNDDYMMVLDTEQEVRDLKPDFGILGKVETRGIIVTAKGEKVDFVSRFFAPRVGVNEDPVTGSTHTSLVPYWSKKLHKTDLIAEQVSERGGKLICRDLDGRVEIRGKAVTYMIGEINFEE